MLLTVSLGGGIIAGVVALLLPGVAPVAAHAPRQPQSAGPQEEPLATTTLALACVRPPIITPAPLRLRRIAVRLPEAGDAEVFARAAGSGDATFTGSLTAEFPGFVPGLRARSVLLTFAGPAAAAATVPFPRDP